MPAGCSRSCEQWRQVRDAFYAGAVVAFNTGDFYQGDLLRRAAELNGQLANSKRARLMPQHYGET